MNCTRHSAGDDDFVILRHMESFLGATCSTGNVIYRPHAAYMPPVTLAGDRAMPAVPATFRPEASCADPPLLCPEPDQPTRDVKAGWPRSAYRPVHSVRHNRALHQAH